MIDGRSGSDWYSMEHRYANFEGYQKERMRTWMLDTMS